MTFEEAYKYFKRRLSLGQCGKWVIDMIPKEINTTAIDWSDENVV